MATLLENWRNLAYGNGLDDKQREQLWTGYFTIEKGIYEQILSNPAEAVSGTVEELADKYQTEVLIMTGFLDGINEWLYTLPQWDSILSEEKRKELYKQQKASGTVRKAKKVFPNDPCPCGSGKKYKKCCGKNA